jgi:hypothetical protein
MEQKKLALALVTKKTNKERKNSWTNKTEKSNVSTVIGFFRCTLRYTYYDVLVRYSHMIMTNCALRGR